MFRSLWFLRATSKRAAAPGRRLKQRLRLHLETLEDRYVLSGLTLTPLMLISNPDPLAGCPAGFLGSDVAVETSIAVNPTDLKNIVAEWIDHGTAGIVAGASFDGGQSWQNVAIPGITQCTGGTAVKAWDPWLSFAPNGDLYSISIGSQAKGPEQFLVNKSTDGGRTWNSPTLVNTIDYSGNGYGPVGDDKPSITADPTNPNYVYATWARFNDASHLKGNSAETMFARSTDGGQTWQLAQSIHTSPSTDFDWGNQIVVLPDGTLMDAFTEGQLTNTHPGVLTLMRSTDHGQTWSAPMAAIVQQPLLDPKVQPPNALVTDPDTGQAVEAHPMFVSIAIDHSSGNLYAVWIDARFSNFQHNSIALSMSTDGGITWSDPIQVNQTPDNVPSLEQQAFNPTVAVAADGTVAVSYYDFRNNTAAPGALTDYWLAYCHPSTTAPVTNPANWSEVRLTDSSFNLEQAPTRFNGALWLGDYEGLAAAGNAFMAAWGMPNGSSTGQESIFFRDPPPQPGPLVLLSNPDVLADFPTNGVLSADAAVEPYVAVNPANTKNIVAGWIEHNFAGTVAGVTLDGCQTWKNVPVTGYVPGYGADPWLAFAPNGDLYFMSVTAAGHMVNKSSDGGLTWSSPIQIDGQDNGTAVDKASITADPTKPNYVYATWVRFNKSFNGNGSETMFARTTDGGKTWEPSQSIHSTSAGEFNWGNQIVVLPDGTLIDAFCEGDFTNNHPLTLTLLRSTDQGQTWSAPISAAVQQPLLDPQQHQKAPIAQVTDPDTGHLVNAVPMFDSIAVDPHSGNLYAVWLDARFGNFQYNSISLSMSSDGGLSWSEPIQVNQTPNTVPPIDRQAWNPTVAVSANGTVAVTYYDFRNNTPAPGALTDYWLASCLPSAAAPATNPGNWSEVRMTGASFDVEQAPTRAFLAGGYSLGDYDGLAAAGKDFVAVWAMPDSTPGGRESIFFRREFSTTGTATAALLPASASLSAMSLSAVAGTISGAIVFPPLSASTLSSSQPLPTSPSATSTSPISAPGTLFANTTSAPAVGDLGRENQFSSPLHQVSLLPRPGGFLTDFAGDLVTDILAENMALVLVR